MTTEARINDRCRRTIVNMLTFNTNQNIEPITGVDTLTHGRLRYTLELTSNPMEDTNNHVN